MKFSERIGIVPVSNIIQMDSMNDELRNSLWNMMYTLEFNRDGFMNDVMGSHRFVVKDAVVIEFSKQVLSDFFKKPLDEIPYYNSEKLGAIREYFFGCPWFEVYEFIEFCIGFFGEGLEGPLNSILERELSGYRIIDQKFVPVSDRVEIESIQAAVSCEVFPGAKLHLRTALDLLSNKTSPDYRNSIKESISAVESACCTITGKVSASLGEALSSVAKAHPLHKALKEGFQRLYGYTSDGDGIRHAMLEESTLTQADAIYFLVSCSAFINYLVVKTSE